MGSPQAALRFYDLSALRIFIKLLHLNANLTVINE